VHVDSRRHNSQPRLLRSGTRTRHWLRSLGPGLITGAADDDPSGIATYSMAGASLGYGVLWTALFTFPLMVAVQLMCARLGAVTGAGLATAIRNRYPRLIYASCALLVFANVVNISADLAGMAECTELLTGVHAAIWSPLYASLILLLLVQFSYKPIARVFKWLTLALLAYVIAAIAARPSWTDVLLSTAIPSLQFSFQYGATLVAVLGTTISPYLFFWQTAEEVEELPRFRRVRRQLLGRIRNDVITGMAYSNGVMFFIMLASAATLHAQGQVDIRSARDAAAALRPFAGATSSWLFALGVIGSGMLAVPVLAGSSAYAIAEASGWRHSLTDDVRHARGFYIVITAGLLAGTALNAAGFSGIRMLYWAAVINGLLAPPLIGIIVLLTADPAVMGSNSNPRWLTLLGWVTAGVMTLAGVILCISYLLTF
jgi:Mn2+/Fe2+ NRAMP family transporter